jgi:hypothetical protein
MESKEQLHRQKPCWAGRSTPAWCHLVSLRNWEHVLHGMEDGWTSAGVITCAHKDPVSEDAAASGI